jgi:hypothetical protein
MNTRHHLPQDLEEAVDLLRVSTLSARRERAATRSAQGLMILTR